MSTDWQNLSRLLEPVSAEHFFQESFEKQWLHVQRDDPMRFADLVTFEDVERVVTTLSPPCPERLQVVSGARKIALNEYTYPTGVPHPGHVFSLYRDGGTIILAGLHMYLPKLFDLVRGLEFELSCRAQTNVYVTPGGNQGFDAHYDNHDVLCVQVTGAKQWDFHDYEPKLELPFMGEAFDHGQFTPTRRIGTLRLRAGESLYIPRGVMHEARANDEPSIHVTIGFFMRSWSELLLEAVARLAKSHRGLRESLPFGYARGAADDAAFQERFRELLRHAADHADGRAVLEHFADDLIQTRLPLVSDQLQQAHRATELHANTVLGVRRHLLKRISVSEESVTLLVYGDEHTFPREAEALLRHALESKRYRLADVAGELDLESAKTVLAYLVHEGCVQVLEPGAAA